MGCNICKNNNEVLIEEEFQYPAKQNSQKENQVIPPTLENKPEEKRKNSSPNINVKKNILQNNNNEIFNNINNYENNKKIIKINEDIIPYKNTNINNSTIKQNNEKEIENELENKERNKEENKMENKEESKVFSISKNDYNSRAIELINEIRLNPIKYSEVIFNNIQFISKEIRIEANDETGQNTEKEEIFFQKKVKVKLYRGEKAFKEAADFLKLQEPINELKVKDEIKLDLPGNEEEINDNKFIRKQLIEMRKKNNISAFFKDSIKNPEVGIMLMIVGDYKDAENKKRNAILNPEYKYIAVNSKFIGDLFFAYYTFSK